MNADSNLQVWLESSAVAQTSVVVPHVKSDVEQLLTYRITTTQRGPSGRSSIAQSGDLAVKPDQATAISRLAIRRDTTGSCHITLIILSSDKTEHHYDFICPGTENSD